MPLGTCTLLDEVDPAEADEQDEALRNPKVIRTTAMDPSAVVEANKEDEEKKEEAKE